eukprot:gb/GECH01009200.1/.p1 GENE.gb/GECH01009200.1/~~gb/GECH01009200.1/.p1  ORF type:complete len:819 (+),score=207.15 gb/GECH01009200.1/:1-2457(+)
MLQRFSQVRDQKNNEKDVKSFQKLSNSSLNHNKSKKPSKQKDHPSKSRIKHHQAHAETIKETQSNSENEKTKLQNSEELEKTTPEAVVDEESTDYSNSSQENTASYFTYNEHQKTMQDRLEPAISDRDISELETILEEASYYRYDHIYAQAQHHLDLAFQMENTQHLIDSSIQQHDGSRLRLAIQNAEMLNMDEELIAFAKEYIPKFQEEEKVKRWLSMAIGSGNRGNIEYRIEEAKKYPFLKEEVKNAEQELEHMEERESVKQRTLPAIQKKDRPAIEQSMKNQLEEACHKQDIKELEHVLDQSARFSALEQEKKEASSILQELKVEQQKKQAQEEKKKKIKSLRKAIKLALENEDEKKLKQLLKKKKYFHDNSLRDIILSAHRFLDFKQEERKVKQELRQACRNKDISELDSILKKSERFLSLEKERKEAALTLRDLQAQKKALKNSKHNLAHPFISTLHTCFNKLMKSCRQRDLNDNRLIVDSSNIHAKHLVKCLNSIYSHRTRGYFFRDRTSWDVFQYFTESSIQNAIREFRSCEAVSTLSKEQFNETVSLLWIQYALDRDYIVYFTERIILHDSYLRQCYYSDSIMMENHARNEFLSVLVLTRQFSFRFGFNNDADETSVSVETMMAHPLSGVKSSVKMIVQHFFRNSKNKSLQNLGDDSKNEKISPLVQNELCESLLSVMKQGFREWGWIQRQNVWHFIEACSRNKQAAVQDISGTDLPCGVMTVNEVMRKHGFNTDYTIKFRSFICWCLNYRELEDIFRGLFMDKKTLKQFYYPNAILLRDDMQEKILSYLKKLSKLPFQLAINAEIVNKL